MTDQPQIHTSDENLMAAFSHFLGFLVALIIWATQKDKSRFVRFQAVQAMAFDLIVYVIVFIAVGCMVGLIFVVLALGIGDLALIGTQNNPIVEPVRILVSLMTAVPFLIPCIFIPLVSLTFVARLIATIQTFQGKDFKYPWLGALVEQSLEH